MTKIQSLVVAAISLSLALVAPACGGGGDCEKVYETAVKCSKDRAAKIGKSEFVAMCEKAKADPKTKDELEGEIKCAKEDSCEKVAACHKEQRGKRRAKKIAEQATAGQWKEAFDDCTLNEDYFADATYKAECTKVFQNADKITGDDLSKTLYRCKSGEKIKAVAPELEAACKKLSAGQLASVTKAATAARDEGKREYKLCLELKDLAEIAGGDATAAAEKLCAEMDIADDAKKATTDARANAAAKKTSLPYQCETAAEKLAKIDSEWAKATAVDVYKACYAELGAVIIAEKEKDAKTRCPYEISKVAEAVRKDAAAAAVPEVAEAMKKLPAKCQKE